MARTCQRGTGKRPWWRVSRCPRGRPAQTRHRPRPAQQRPLPSAPLPSSHPDMAKPSPSVCPALGLPRPHPVPYGVALPPSLPPPESGAAPKEEAPTLALTSPSPLAPATLSQSMEGISLLQLLHYSRMVSTVAFRCKNNTICRFCIGAEVGATPQQPWQHTCGAQEIILLLGYGLDSPPKKLFLLTFMKLTGSHPLEQSHEQVRSMDNESELQVHHFSWRPVLSFI